MGDGKRETRLKPGRVRIPAALLTLFPGFSAGAVPLEASPGRIFPPSAVFPKRIVAFAQNPINQSTACLSGLVATCFKIVKPPTVP